MINFNKKAIYALTFFCTALLLTTLFFLTRTFLMESFSRAEKTEMESDIKNTVSVVRWNAAEFSDRFADWSSWDDTCQFLLDKNPAFISSNMNDESMSVMNLGLLAFFDANGGLVAQTAFDPQGRKRLLDAETLKEHFSPGSLLLQHETLRTFHAGLLDLPQGVMIVSSRPIINSKNEGPKRGTLIDGRYFDERQIARLSFLTGHSLAVFPLDASKMPADAQRAFSLLKNSPVAVLPADERTISGYAFLKDVYGKPILLMRIQMPRNIYGYGRTSVFHFRIWILAIVMLSLVIALWLIGKVIKFHDDLRSMIQSLQETKDRLTQSEKLASLGTVVSGVAHEINNPLTSIIGFSDIIMSRDDGSLPAEMREQIDIIHKEGQRCKAIVQDLLSFARRRDPVWENVTLDVLLTDVTNAMSLMLREKEVRVEKTFPSETFHIKADSTQLKQVFFNLLKNAVQAMEDSGKEKILWVQAVLEEKHVRVTVTDNGSGIRPEHLHRIFEPFFTTKEVGIGTGLGLSLCYGVIHQHGGEIGVANAPGKGAEFAVRLPLIGAAEARELDKHGPVASLPAQRLSGHRVLVIDDESSIRKLLQAILSAEKIPNDAVNNGAEALEKSREVRYDLFICDYRTPRLNGQQFYLELAKKDPKIASKFLFITGQTGDKQLMDFFKTNGIDYLTKPFFKNDVLEMVRKKLKNASAA